MSRMKELAMQLSAVEVHGREIQDVCHGLAEKAGWWMDVSTGGLFTPQERLAMVPTKLMLIVSECSEAMEAHRKNLMDDKLHHRQGLEVELADAAIRIFDLAGALGLDLGAAMAEKLQYNVHRPDHKIASRRSSSGKTY